MRTASQAFVAASTQRPPRSNATFSDDGSRSGDPQTPRPTFPFLVWTPATGAMTSWPIPACAQPEGLRFDGRAAVFDCNNSCCDSSDESLLLFRAGQPAPFAAASGEGSGGQGGSFLRGYGLDGETLIYGRSLEGKGDVRADLWLLEHGHRTRLRPLVGDVVAYAAGRIALLRRGKLDVIGRHGRRLYRLSLPVQAIPASAHFHSPAAPILLGRDFGVALSGRHLIAWDAKSGRRRGKTLVPPGVFLDDLAGRRAAIVVGKAVWVFDLANGRRRSTTSGHRNRSPRPRHGRLLRRRRFAWPSTPTHLVVAYNVSARGAEPGRVAVIKLGRR